MRWTAESLSEVSVETLCDNMNAAFEGYAVPVLFSPALLSYMLRYEALDLRLSSRSFLAYEFAAVALINERGWRCRLGAMGVATAHRQKGAAFWLLERTLCAMRERGSRTMELEVLDVNAPALHLYEKAGFEKVERLAGYFHDAPEGAPNAAIEEIDPNIAAKRLLASALDLPWQVAGETLVQQGIALKAYRYQDACLLCTQHEGDIIRVRGLLPAPAAQTHALLRGLFATFPNHHWKAPILFPEAYIAEAFEPMGFQREALGQYRMRRSLQ